MLDEGFGIDLSDWEALTPAQRSALTRLVVRRAHAARNRDAGKIVLAALSGAGEWLGALARQRSALLLRRAAAGLPWSVPRRKEF